MALRQQKQAERRQRQSAYKIPEHWETYVRSSRIQPTDVKANLDRETAPTGVRRVVSTIVAVFLILFNVLKRQRDEKMEQSEEDYDALGFTGSAWKSWRKTISDEIFVSQTLHYWLHNFVDDTERNESPTWDGENHTKVFTKAFGMSEKAAYTLAHSLSMVILLSQTPAYWVHEWIREREQQCSKGFKDFVTDLVPRVVGEFVEEKDPDEDGFEDTEGEDENGSGGDDDNDDKENWDDNEDVEESDPVHIPVIKWEVLKESDQSPVQSLLDHRRLPANRPYWFHTTDWAAAEDIALRGINQARSHPRQDFGGRTASFYLNHDWNAAVDWGVKRFPRNTAILVYDLEATLASNTKYTLDLKGKSQKKLLSTVVRDSRSEKRNISDTYRFVVGPQARNGDELIHNKNAKPIAHDTLLQTAVKGNRATNLTNKAFIGIILTRKK